MEPPKHSKEAIAKYPAPVREDYRTGRHYALLCMEVHKKRIAYDKREKK